MPLGIRGRPHIGFIQEDGYLFQFVTAAKALAGRQRTHWNCGQHGSRGDGKDALQHSLVLCGEAFDF